jgi:hypothetical protein
MIHDPGLLTLRSPLPDRSTICFEEYTMSTILYQFFNTKQSLTRLTISFDPKYKVIHEPGDPDYTIDSRRYLYIYPWGQARYTIQWISLWW